MNFRTWFVSLVVAFIITAVAAPASAQALETETARVLPSGMLEAGAGIEVQGSSEGTETAAPLFVEIGIGGRFELVVEQVAFTRIKQTGEMSATEMRATGVGDLELTALGLVVRENGPWPAFALAAEVKVPTARNALIGTGELDYTGYLILSKRLGKADLHANFGYAILGAPAGTKVNNVFNYAVATTVKMNHRLDVFGEVYGNTTSSATSTMGTVNPEFAGGELVAVAGASYWPARWLKLSLGISVDNNAAVLVHPGVTLYHQLF